MGHVEVIAADWLLADPDQPPVRGGAIAVCDGSVVAVGTPAGVRQAYPEATFSAGSGEAILPGFVNSHTHMYGVLAHGIRIPRSFTDFQGFLESFWWPEVEDRLDSGLVGAATRWACVEMIESGCTALCDVLEAPYARPGALDIEAAVLEAAGLRAVLSFESSEHVSKENGQAALLENAAFIERQRSRQSLVQGMMSVHTSFSCSPEFLAQASAMARELQTGLQLHLSESRYEPQWCKERYGTTPVEFYERFGFWGPHVLASQCVQVEPHEIEILAERGVRASHMPLSNCEVGGGVAPVPDMLERGITVGIGTDGYVNNMFELMRGAFLIHKAHRRSTTVMPARTVVQLATTGGARAIGLPELGRLAVGGPADWIRIRLDLPTPVEEHNFFDQIVLYRNPGDVLDVAVGGRYLKRRGEVLALDTERVRAEVREAAERFWRR